MPPFDIRRLLPQDAAAFRALRLEGLAEAPELFGASLEAEQGKPLEWFAGRLAGSAVFGGGLEATALQGVAGLLVPDGAKQRHKGLLWGMFVQRQARGTGLGAALLAHLLDHAATVVEEVRLETGIGNAAALRLYARAGFRQYGTEPRSLKVGDTYFDSALMQMRLR